MDGVSPAGSTASITMVYPDTGTSVDVTSGQVSLAVVALSSTVISAVQRRVYVQISECTMDQAQYQALDINTCE